ncbi:MAG TPA: choice-of-anchor X domain-containing protein [Myxococcaceae bacterium]|nr:choice-of-anchor X domain-containing protein [Myxococcaceae bacterium]
MHKPSWNRSSRWSLRGLFFVTALSVGCGSAEESGQEPALEQQQQRQEEVPEVNVPRLASLTAIAQEELHERSRTLLQATLAPGQKEVTELRLDSDVGEPALLRDDGREGDEKAGDGVFSGLGFVNFKAEIQQNERVAEFSARFGDKLVKGTFDGRELVRQEPLRPLPRDIFKPFNPIPLQPVGISFAIDSARSLLVRHSSVVNDVTRTYDPCTNTGNPNGVWTFNHLMTEMANQPVTGISPSTFTRRWLKHWESTQSVNFWNVPARANMVPKIITPWPKLPDGSLDMSRSAFKLVAIVNRLDLGKGTAPAGYGGGNGGGELRFVFAAVDRSGGSCSVSPFLVIFEYGVPKTGCTAVKSWAQQWANLSLIALGNAAFNPALEALTQQVVLRNTVPTKPNGNAINQIRTNENLLNPTWELREFRLFASGATPNHLSQHTVVLTPGDARNNTADFASFVNTNSASILANTYTVPLDWPVVGTQFLGGNSLVPFPPSNVFWRAPGIMNNNARHKVSFNTCNGCHGGEMGTFFTHISETGALSPFLSGPFTKSDPVLPAVSRNFNEMLDRQQHLDSVASQSCLVRALDVRSALVH